ncbi:hypothetical protein BDZ45DRAFT_587951 [Acephala macrosclerotiorum]|nr:hypothetical protein BDZ45DRAFT_587951 [Acephala macrosclerotiorum]
MFTYSANVALSRWLISMCANELLITIATCKRPYFEFLAMKRGSRGDMTELREDNFLHMKEHGPYQVKYHSHLVAALERLYILLSNT